MGHYPEVSSGPDNFKKRQEAIKKKLNEAAKSSGSEILKKQAKRESRERPEIQDNCQMARMLLNEGLQMYESGDMTFPEFVADLHKSLMALSGGKESDEEDEG